MKTSTTKGRLDKLGVILSVGCLIHCLLLPIILPLLPMLGLAIGHNGYFHLTMCGIIFINLCATLLPGVLMHKKALVLVLGIYGFLAILAGGLVELLSPNMVNVNRETMGTMMGSCMLVLAHYLNHRYRCACKHHHCHGEIHGQRTQKE